MSKKQQERQDSVKESPKRRSRLLQDDALQLLTPVQVAGLLSVSRSTVDRLIVSGRLPVVVLMSGRRKKLCGIRRQALANFIRKNER